MGVVFSKEPLSASTDGRMVQVAAVSTGGTTIHTAQASATTFDEVWIYATNSNASSVNLTIEWGGTGTSNEIKLAVPAVSGLTLVIPGLILRNSKAVTAYASVANVIGLSGYVNRMS